MQDVTIHTYREFWPFYLSQHTKRGTKIMHTVGLLSGIVTLGVGLSLQIWALIPIAFVVGYGFAWTSHFLIEKNRPATFRWPVWSFFSDFRLAYGTIVGKL